MSNICQWMLGKKLQGTSLVLQFNGDGLLVPAGLGSTWKKMWKSSLGLIKDSPWCFRPWCRCADLLLSTTALTQWQLLTMTWTPCCQREGLAIPYQAGQLRCSLKRGRRACCLYLKQWSGCEMGERQKAGLGLSYTVSETACLQSACRNHDTLS